MSNLNYYNNISVASEIIQNKDSNKPTINYSNLTNNIDETIYRFSGFYMPIFYTIELFQSTGIDSGNFVEYGFKFDTTLSSFGNIKERKVRKINHKESVLKLYNTKSQKSIYPMLDEFGYAVVDSFIFKSTWDYNYHYFTSIKEDKVKNVKSQEVLIKDLTNFGIQSDIKNINL